MTKRKIGNILMIAGFVYALGTLMFVPDAKEASMFGFALIGFGCVLGINDKTSSNTPPKTKGTKKKNK